MRNNTLHTFIFAVLLTLGITCAPSAYAGGLTATQTLDKVVSTMESAPSVTLIVTLRNGSKAFDGTLTMAREKFFYRAGEMTVYYDGKTQWTVQPSAGEVFISIPTAEEIVETNPLAFMRGYKKNYTVAMKKTTNGNAVITLKSKVKSAYIRNAEVTVNTSTWMPTHVSALLATGQTLTINVASAQRGSKLPDSFFQFNAKRHPGLETIDLR